MKIQVIVVVSSDGSLALEDLLDIRIESGKYGIETLKNRTDLILNKDSSLIVLLEEKRKASTLKYLVKITSSTFDFVKGLFLYNLVDELILYQIPSVKNIGFRLSELTNLPEWKLIEQQSINPILFRLIYRRNK